ncbi:MAG: hypothetical protein CR997_12525 [Acidobacteria bacterium]|nr:MAG: hypothetical protein CR997_12525 [Acidobacteriota bacterium]
MTEEGATKKSTMVYWLYQSYLIILGLGLLFVIVPASWILIKSYEGQVEEQLADKAELIKKIIAHNERRDDYASHFEAIFSDSPFRVTLVDADGTVIVETDTNSKKMENHANRPEIIKAWTGKDNYERRYSHTLGKNMLYYATAYLDQYVVRVSKPIRAIHSTLFGYLLKIAITALLAALLAVFVSIYVGKRLTMPLKKLGNQADYLAKAFLDVDIEPSSKFIQKKEQLSEFKTKEYHQLSETMNRMAAQLIATVNSHKEQSYFHKALLKSMVESVLAVDMDGNILICNRAAEEMYQLPKDRCLPGQNAAIFIRNQVLLHSIHETMESGEPLVKEIKVYNPTERSLEVTIVPLKGFDGNQMGAVAVGQDLTGVKAVSKMRKDFVANVSHELKTPITAIKGFIETLLSSSETTAEDQKTFLEIALKHTDRMNAIISDLLSLTHLEDRKNDFELHKTQLNSIVEEVIESCQEMAAEKNITLENQLSAPCEVRANMLLLEQAFFNILSNAIKYSPEKTAVLVKVQEFPKYCQIDFIDEGEGIPKKYRKRIFERFFRVDKGRSKKVGGTGLGLAIAKHIVGVHHGKIMVSSKKGKGSVFTVQIPKLDTERTGFRMDVQESENPLGTFDPSAGSQETAAS